MKPVVLKANALKLKYLRDILNSSVLCKNPEVIQLFDNMSAKMHAFPAIIPFKRKEFIHELKTILKHLPDKELTSKMVHIAHKLPTSTENKSAFIVKHANASPEKICFYLFYNSLRTIDHLHAKHNGGKNKISNYGLCRAITNKNKTDIRFDIWCRKHPETYENAQKHVDRLIELYNQGVFAKVGLEREYITEFAKTIKNLSPKEKPLILDLGKLEK